MEDKEKTLYSNQKKAALFIVVVMLFFSYFYMQETRITKKLQKCSFYTIMTPIRMPDTHKMYFYYNFRGKKIESSTNVGAENLGFFYTKNSALEKKYFVQIYCQDFKTNRVCWEFKVPDTLQYIPTNGWNKIPYGLDKK